MTMQIHNYQQNKIVLNGGIIGFGRMGITHFSILNGHPNVKFVSVSDTSSFMLKNIKKHLILKTFSNYKEMIDTMDLDFIIISNPTEYHSECVKYSIEKGLHTFVEKPFTLNSHQGKVILELLENKNLVNQVGYVVRFNDVICKVRELIQSRTLGKTISFKMEMYGSTVLKSEKSSWRSNRRRGGGCLYDFASHSIDMINYIFGPPDQVVGSELKSIHSREAEDAVYSTFLYENGLSGNLLVNWSDPSFRKPSYNIEINTQEGKIIADLHEYKVFSTKDGDNGLFKKGWNFRYITEIAEPVRYYVRGYEFTRQLDHFIECILDQKENDLCSFEDGLTTDIIIESILKDFKERTQRNG